jgi:hypothetical protein
MRTRSMVLALGLLLSGCSSGSKTCLTDTDCPKGQYCGAAGKCTYFCKTDQDCPGGTCSASGRCIPGTTDGPQPWPFDGGVPDIPFVPLPDLWPQPDINPWYPDTQPWWPDLWPQPDYWPWYPDMGNPCAKVGQPCTTSGGQCGTGDCIVTHPDGVTGVCTCACTPDDPSTPLTVEDTCPNPGVNRCAPLGGYGYGQGYCFKLCKPKLYANDCQGGLSCDIYSGAAVGLFDVAVCLFYGCTSGADCPVFLNKSCTTTSSSSCAAGEQCYPLVAGQTAGWCAKAGTCDSISGLCAAHVYGSTTAQIGAPCKDDTECAGNMRCMMEYDDSQYRKKGGLSCQEDSECCSGYCQGGVCTSGLCLVRNRNGYCTIAGCKFASSLTTAACPSGSTCNELYSAGLCQKNCTLSDATSCRNNTADLYGDYECRAWDSLGVTTGPVCDFGPSVGCDFLSNSTYDCTSLGDSSNSTQMECRGLDGQSKTNKYDSLGYCLDTTSSGTAYRSPMPTP